MLAIRRRPMLAALVALLVIVLAGTVIVIVANPFGKSATATSEQTIWQSITGRIRDSQPSKDVALQAFAYAYKINIPGVQVPAGVDGADVPNEGTMVASWVQANWNQLTPDQQAVITPYVQAGANDTVLTFDLTAPSGATTGRRIASTGAFDTTGNQAAPLDAPDFALQVAFNHELLADIAHIGERLGLPPISDEVGFFGWSHVTIDFSDEDGGNTAFLTHAYTWNGIYTPCNIIVYHNSWVGQQPNGDKLPDVLHVLLMHEVVHCDQNVIWDSVEVSDSIPDWITEGTAMWLAADDTKMIEPLVPSTWRDGYFARPERPLTNRTYDAYGYYALLDHLGRNLWSLMVPAWQEAQAAAVAVGQNSSDAFIGVLNGDATDVRNAWAPSYLRQDGWGDPWIAYGFGLPDDVQVGRHAITACDDPSTTTPANPPPRTPTRPSRASNPSSGRLV